MKERIATTLSLLSLIRYNYLNDSAIMTKHNNMNGV